MPQIAANGVELNYDLTGPEDAPVITLSNSLSSNLHMWDDQMEALSGYRVLRYDKRGHGSSSAPEGPYTLELLADDVIGLWDALGIEESHYCGLSIGGMIGQALALKKPSQLQALMLCDTSSRIPADAAPTWDERIATAEADGMAALVEGTIGRWLSEGFIAREPDRAEKVRKMIRTTSVTGYAGCCRAISQLDYTDRVSEIDVPTKIVVGENDPGTPVKANEVIHQRIAGSEFQVIPDALHLPNIEQREIFNASLTEFLAKH